MSKIKVPEFLLNEKETKKMSIEKRVSNIVSFLQNEYNKRYPLGVEFVVEMSYLDDDMSDYENIKDAKEIKRTLLERHGVGILTCSEGKFKCYNAKLLYDICCELNQRNRKFAISASKRRKKNRRAIEGKDFKYYDCENVYVMYRGSDNARIRKITK